jgi:hypothetical protein
VGAKVSDGLGRRRIEGSMLAPGGGGRAKKKQSTRHLFGRKLFVFQPGAQEGHCFEPREPVEERAGETARRGKGGGGEEGEEGGEEESQGSRSPPPWDASAWSHNQGAAAGVGSQTQRVWAPAPPSLLFLARWGKKALPCSLFASLPPSFPPFLPPSCPPFLPPSCPSCSLAIQPIIHDQNFASFPHSLLPPSFPPTRPSPLLLLHALEAFTPYRNASPALLRPLPLLPPSHLLKEVLATAYSRRNAVPCADSETVS